MSIPKQDRVLVTGATGLLGSHTVRALLDTGYSVRALVRSIDKANRVFADRADTLQLCLGAIEDRASIEAALDGCDAIVHCAAIVAVDASSDSNALIETNVAGVKNVVEPAIDRGIDRIVHVSSIVALFGTGEEAIPASAALPPSRQAYSQSKTLAEHYVRELQASGCPVKILYPGAILGPDDPGLSESMRSVQLFARRFLPLTTSGVQYVDARDLATALVRLVEDEPRSLRVQAPGRFILWADLAALLNGITGKRPPAYPVPASALRFAGRLADRLRRVVPIEVPLSAESAAYATQWKPMETSDELGRLGVTFRSLEETMTDTVRWMQRAGHL